MILRLVGKLRKYFGIRAVLVAALVILPGMARPARAEIRYTVSVADRAAHMFHVTMTVPDAHGKLVVAMPAWNATYLMRDFAERVEDVRASADGKPLAVRELTGDTWQIDGNGTIEIRYRIFWNSPGPFSSQLNAHHAFINYAEVLFYVPSRRTEASEVEFTGLPADWKVAVELPKAPHCASETCFDAGNYDLLTDAPTEIGTFTEFRFVENGAHLRVAMDALNGAEWDKDQLETWLRKIVGYETKVMREAPFHEYLFLYHIGPGAGGGGMEHSNGTAIAVPQFAQIPAVTAHEFFHLWNVKRIRPQSITPYDYEHPMWTRSLWFAEGVTSTYGAYTMLRSGLWTPEQYCQHLGQQISELQARPARLWQSVEESSLETWLEKYPFYERPERSISYYNKGELDGVLLDILIRDATNNRKSLDDVMRYMNATYAHEHRYYDGSAAIQAAVEHVAGRSFSDFFGKYVAGTAEIPWNEILGRAGLGVQTEQAPVADPGFEWQAGAGGAQVTEVTPGGAAEKAGIAEGDVVISADGVPLPRYAGFWIAEHKPGETVQLRVAREGKQLALPLTLRSREEIVYHVAPVPDPTAKARTILEGVLQGTTGAE
ncbi:MAG: M61 family metallopeptidase [Acidobacteriota bacterium]|nr:M61 family metallopeptidase [Acidobacteriota bacterium]